MKKERRPITDIIGILLVIVALVSAGGLCYIANEYTRISDTLVSIGTDISSVRLVQNNATGEIAIYVIATIDNPSSLDIQVFRVEYQTYVDWNTATITSFDRYIGSGSTNANNGTVQAGSIREIQISHVVKQDTLYMERIENAQTGGSVMYVATMGFLWYRIYDYPDVQQKVPLGYLSEAVIHYV